mmetsp:Transcript_20205/g.47131  ORF Transcript_20205/g.47131 Transcript_20205/m.47131 type:complete len:782 (-) Transcript_20205:141-2486(-)
MIHAAPIWGACPGAAFAPPSPWESACHGSPSCVPDTFTDASLLPVPPSPVRLLPQPLARAPSHAHTDNHDPSSWGGTCGVRSPPHATGHDITVGDRVAELLRQAQQAGDLRQEPVETTPTLHSARPTLRELPAPPPTTTNTGESQSGAEQASGLQWVPSFTLAAKTGGQESSPASQRAQDRRPGQLRLSSGCYQSLSPVPLPISRNAGASDKGNDLKQAKHPSSTRSTGAIGKAVGAERKLQGKKTSLDWRPSLLPLELEEPPAPPWEVEGAVSTRPCHTDSKPLSTGHAGPSSSVSSRKRRCRKRRPKSARSSVAGAEPSLRSLLVPTTSPRSAVGKDSSQPPACPWQEEAHGSSAMAAAIGSDDSSDSCTSPLSSKSGWQPQAGRGSWLQNEQRRLFDMTLYMEAMRWSGRRMSGLSSGRRSVAESSSTGIPSSSASTHRSSCTDLSSCGRQDLAGRKDQLYTATESPSSEAVPRSLRNAANAIAKCASEVDDVGLRSRPATEEADAAKRCQPSPRRSTVCYPPSDVELWAAVRRVEQGGLEGHCPSCCRCQSQRSFSAACSDITESRQSHRSASRRRRRRPQSPGSSRSSRSHGQRSHHRHSSHLGAEQRHRRVSQQTSPSCECSYPAALEYEQYQRSHSSRCSSSFSRPICDGPSSQFCCEHPPHSGHDLHRCSECFSHSGSVGDFTRAAERWCPSTCYPEVRPRLPEAPEATQVRRVDHEDLHCASPRLSEASSALRQSNQERLASPRNPSAVMGPQRSVGAGPLPPKNPSLVARR